MKEETNLEQKKLDDDLLDQVSGGYCDQTVTYDCCYCGEKHALTLVSDNRLPHGLRSLKNATGEATSYFCRITNKYFYTVKLKNGGLAILDDKLKIIK